MVRKLMTLAGGLAIVVAAGCTAQTGTSGGATQVPVPVPAPASPSAPAGPQPAAGSPGTGTGALPLGKTGVGDLRITNVGVAQVEVTDGVGAFRTVCGYSHMAYDDPIVAPGAPGGSHLHSFFGNSGTNAFTTAESVLTGNSTCSGGAANRSAYWVPSLIDTAANAPVTPREMMVYYKSGYQGVDNAAITVPPKGLRMIAGDAKATAAQSWKSYRQIQWQCQDTKNKPLGDPTATFVGCPGGAQVNLAILFPQCWDGINLDSPDHKSHMSFGVWDFGCPASHPVAIPEIMINVKWIVPAGGSASWRLSSDVDGAPAGASAHADWWNGWDDAVMTKIVNNCLHTGTDCQVDSLGDGTRLAR